MAHPQGPQPSTRPSGRSAFGRAVVWALVAVSAVRGLREGPAAPRRRDAAAPTTTGADDPRSATVDDTGGPRPGGEAGAPTQIPPSGWWQVIRRAFAESTSDNVGILAGGVAFFAFLAIPPR